MMTKKRSNPRPPNTITLTIERRHDILSGPQSRLALLGREEVKRTCDEKTDEIFNQKRQELNNFPYTITEAIGEVKDGQLHFFEQGFKK